MPSQWSPVAQRPALPKCLVPGMEAPTWTQQLSPPIPTDQEMLKDRKDGPELQLLLWLLPSFALAGGDLVSGEGLKLLFSLGRRGGDQVSPAFPRGSENPLPVHMQLLF